MLKPKQIFESAVSRPTQPPEKNEKVNAYVHEFASETSKPFAAQISGYSSPNLRTKYSSIKISKDIWKKIGIGAVAATLVILSATTFYFYRQWRQIKTDPQKMAKNALSEVVAEVGKIMELPADEEPTMATVTGVEKLKDQPFFAKAQNGDKALIYSKAGKAILYRPESHKIIEVISLIGSSQSVGSQIPQEQQPKQ